MIDILMPFYGRVDYFKVAVESVRTQSDPDWRLIVVDDVYPDKSAARWVNELADRRIRYVRNATNLGVSGNFNKAISLTDAQHVVIAGCDDVMDPGYIRRVKELLVLYPEADIVQPGVRLIDRDGHDVRPLVDRVKDHYRPGGPRPRILSGEPLATSLLKGNWAYFPSLVWRRTALVERGYFRLDRNVVQDLTMLFEIIADGGTLVLDDVVVFAYRRHRASHSALGGPDASKFREEVEFFHDAAEVSERLGWPRAARAARRHFSSRLHALSELPHARGRAARRLLLRHALTSWGGASSK